MEYVGFYNTEKDPNGREKNESGGSEIRIVNL